MFARWARTRACVDLFNREVADSDEGEVRSRWFSQSTTDHAFGYIPFPKGTADVLFAAGDERIACALDWARRWRLAVDDKSDSWIVLWATYALLRRDVARWCLAVNGRDCIHNCAAARESQTWLNCVLTSHDFYNLTEHEEIAEDWRLLERYCADSEMQEDSSDWNAPGRRKVDLFGLEPDPLTETRDDFLQKAVTAWDAAVSELKGKGVNVAWPRRLEEHCSWLVDYYVLEKQAVDITDRTPSALYHAVTSLNEVIGLPLDSRVAYYRDVNLKPRS